MAETAGSIQWDLDLDATKFKKGLKDSVDQASGFGSKVGGVMAGVGKAVIGMGVVAGTAFAGFAALSVKAASESQAALEQLNAVIKSTGGIAGVTTQAAIDLSKSLQRTSTFSDEAVLGAENLLLTFTNIGKDVFPTATQAVLDMSTALGQDTKEGAIQLGKALQDPIVGVTALRRVGVAFSQDQRDLIKKLVETNHLHEAQAIILKEVQKEFGGSAKAATKTFGGALKQLNNSMNDLQETFGLALIEAIQPFVKSLADWANSQAGQDAIQSLILGFKEFTRIVANLITILRPLAAWWINTAISIGKFLQPAVESLLKSLQPLWEALVRLWPVIQPLLALLGVALVAAIYALIVALTFIINTVTFVINAFVDFVNWIGIVTTAVGNFVNNFINFFIQLPTTIGNIINSIINWFRALPYNIGLAIGQLINSLLNFQYNVIPNFVNNVVNWIASLPPRIWGIFNWLIGVIASFAPHLWNWGINLGSNLVNGFMNFMNSLPGRVNGIFNDVVNTIAGWGGKLFDRAVSIAGQFWNGFKKGLGIKSPSYIEKAFMKIGKQSDVTLSQLKGDMQDFNNYGRAIAPAGVSNNETNNKVETNIHGNIVIGSDVQAGNFLSKLSRNQELAGMGLATIGGDK